ncbi:MAG: glycosyltransferase [Gemmatimonadota bacterium]
MDTGLLIALIPWVGLFGFVTFVTRFPSELPDPPESDSGELDGVLLSVIVPARNEAVNIETCVRSLTESDFPSFEVIVVDDRSEDDTYERAARLTPGRAERLDVVRGEPLPDGWLGKPWACHQGAARAGGSWLLFTDADTTHGPRLARKAVFAAVRQDAGLFTVVGRQLVETFWEKLVQTQVFLTMLLRFPDFEATAKNDRWRDAIANGQFLLFRRSAYEAIGGHEAVRNEVVEDLALAQHVKRAGLPLRIGGAKDDLATRMYRSLSELIEGWTKNLVLGGQQSLPRWLRGAAAPLTLVVGVVVWLVPPAVVLLWSAGGGFDFGGVDLSLRGETFAEDVGEMGTTARVVWWAGLAYALNTLTWGAFARRVDVSVVYAPLHPLGAAVGAWIFMRAWWRGDTVEWKGRRYDLPPVSERA